MDIDDFLALVEEKVTAELRGVGASSSPTRHWVVIKDAVGVESAGLEAGSPAPHELLASLVDGGADAAAYVTHVPAGPERVLAQLLIAEPRNSDVRQASVVRQASGDVELAEWEYTV